jgi:hypothetical protein
MRTNERGTLRHFMDHTEPKTSTYVHDDDEDDDAK